MGRDDKVGFKCGNSRRKVRSKDQGSDESDEDFIIGEGEEHESDEYCSSLDPDESEEALLELELDEEEEVTTKVKKAARSKTRKTVSAKRRKRSKKKPKKKNRFSYKQDEDDDDEFVEDDDDAEFIPDEIDYVDRDDETPVTKKRRVSYREEEDEEDNDDIDDDDYNNEDEKEEYENNEIEDEGEFTLDAIDFVDEEDDMLLQNKDKVRNPNSRERGIAKGRKRRRNSDVMKKPTSTSRKPRTKHRLVRKTRSGSVPRLARKSSSGTDGEFANKSLVVEDKSKKNSVRRRKYVASSDSDFMSLASSDNEYTSEKEREHHRLERKTSSDIAPIARLARKRSGATDGELANKNLMGEDRSKKTTVRRRRKLVASSDSDFISPASDFDYTISEEEREQVREANKFCNFLNTNSRSSSSLKKCEEEEDICKQRKRPGRKGKEKLEDLNKVVKQVCGICLSEEGKRTIRGTLNSCSHFFCFACIMEWSKVESRCPLCKQRFATITKPARSDSGFDLRTVVIQVPECDQVYQPSEDELRGFLDPYDGVICTECHQGGDDALMLLCDICDSPAHTYCVGLGREVPEGNWYCEGCRPAASGAPSPHGLNPALDQRASNFLSSLSSPVHNVGELDLNSLYVPDTPLTQQNGPFPIPRRFGSEFHVASPTSGSGVFTVHNRRMIQRQIQHLLNTRRNPSRIQSNAMPSRTSGIRLFGSQIDGGTGLAIQRTVTPETRTLEYTSHRGRLQDNTNTFLHNRDASSSRSIMMSEQGQNSELGGIGMVFNSRLAYEQLHPCNSRSNIDSDDPSYTFRETAIPSRTSQGSLRRPF